MTSKQKLNAISKYYTKRREEKQNDVLRKYNLEEDFKKSKYKSLTAYLKSKFKDGTLKDWLEVYGE